MARDWSKQEVEATVADYFDMLRCELRGTEYSKAIHRRTLQGQLDDRSEGAIEMKHQNISAVLNQLGLCWIRGYKPKGNYQLLLRESIEAYLASHPEVRQELIRPPDGRAGVSRLPLLVLAGLGAALALCG